MRGMIDMLVFMLGVVSVNAQSLPLYINAGGTVPYTSGGVTWVPDTPYVSNGALFEDKRVDIIGTTDDTLYQSERFFRAADGIAQYKIRLPTGVTRVEVTLLFAEIHFTLVGQRTFDIAIEGATLASQFDIVKEATAPRTALEFRRTVTVLDGSLTVTLTRRVQNPKISGIKVVAISSPPPPVMAPIMAPVAVPAPLPAPVVVALPTPTTSALLRLDLIHAPTNAVMRQISNGAIVDLKNFGLSPQFNIEAVPLNNNVAMVRFVETNRNEGVRPFAFCGDSDGKFFVCPTLGMGSNSVTAIAMDAAGKILGQVAAAFQVIDTRPTKAPTRAPTRAPAQLVETLPRWIEITADAPIDERHEASFVMVNNPTTGRKAYLVGGRGSKALDIFDPATRTWSKGASPPIQMHHMQAVAAQGKLWVVSPWTDWYPEEKNVPFIYVYDPVTNTWSTKPGLPVERRRGGAAVIVSTDEKKIYVSHGNNGGHETVGKNHATSLGYLDEYDIATETWKVLSSNAPNPRDHTGGAMINGRICVAGGRNGGEAVTESTKWPSVAPTDCYDLATGQWSVEAPIPQVRAGSAYGKTCDGKLFIAGGEGGGKAWDDVHVFDGKSWTTLPKLNKGRHGTGAAVDCVCNQIIIASGALAQGGGPESRSVEIFVPAGVSTECRS